MIHLYQRGLRTEKNVFYCAFFFFKRMGYERLHLEAVPVLLASCTGLPRREQSDPQRVLPPLARVQGSAPKSGHRVGMLLKASKQPTLSQCPVAWLCLA